MADPAPVPAVPPAPLPAPEPYTAAELRAVLGQPGRALALVLAERERLAASITAGPAPWRLVLVLLACTAAAALPYGLVRGAWWRVAALYGGSVLLCWPALQVFGAYLGSRVQPLQSLALALVIASVAALFTLGFCPIVWFLDRTMANGDWVDAGDASVAALAMALAAGLLQLLRCAAFDRTLRPRGPVPWLLLGWQALVVFVALRMARALDLLG